MTDLEISIALALAIGWSEENVIEFDDVVYVDIAPTSPRSAGWRVFDYRDEVIAFRVAERYDAFPVEKHTGKWMACHWECHWECCAEADTPQKAIAMAVIQGAKK